MQAENTLLKEDLVKLQKQLERLEQEHHEHVEVLEFQVKAHRDDWEAERSEKQQAVQEKAAIELQVKELKKDLRSLKLKVLYLSLSSLLAGCIINFYDTVVHYYIAGVGGRDHSCTKNESLFS
jgi:dynactin complex subunit